MEAWICSWINTTEALAEDVYKDNLDFLLKNKEIDKNSIDSIYLNAKGFGGNNASAGIISPTRAMDLAKKEFSSRFKKLCDKKKKFWSHQKSIKMTAEKVNTKLFIDSMRKY